MIRLIGFSLLLPILITIWIVVTVVSPFTLNKHWVEVDKRLNRYESFWKTWRKNIKEIWTDDMF